jgi:arylsulfatase A-like enzyme/cytochrome c-type biogenesis protein CcmH/NrfG
MRKRSRGRKPAQAMKKRIVTAAVCAVMALIAWGSIRCNRATPPPAVPRNILLITIDTLRADALGAYGNTRAVTPLIDRLAHGGLRFDNARAHNVVTLPSHANILTGRLPIDHGVRDNSGFRVPANEETLATWLKARGFRTGAFVSAFPLDSRFGLARGFDEYDDRFVDATARPAMLEQERPGTATVAAAARWIASQDGKWFCWVHLYEPHFPYAPPPPFDARFASDAYAGEVAAADDALRPLLQPILDAGSSTPTLVVLTSDHGESLGDHGEATHGIFAYDATLKVPLIVYYPPLLKPRTIATPAGHVDIAPTILRALGIESFPGVRGRNLIVDPRGERQEVIYFEALSGSLNRGWAPLTGIVANGMKYVDLPVAELYDLAGDPQERHNLAAERTKEVGDLRARLAAFAAGASSRTSEDAETRRRLQSLGYISSNTSANAAQLYTEKDDPKHLIKFETRLQEVVDLYLNGRLADALGRARALTAEQPRMRVALIQLAQLEREAGNGAAAVAALQRALKLHPIDPQVAALLGASLTAAGRQGDAIALLKPFAEQSTADSQVLVTLALAQARNHRADEGLALVARARAADPSNAMLLVDTGTIHLMAGDRIEARKAFEAALAQNPDVARAHRSLAVMAMEDGTTDAALSHWRAAAALDPGEYGNLLSVAVSLIRRGRDGDARPYLQFFADNAPQSRYAGDIAKARSWLAGGR